MNECLDCLHLRENGLCIIGKRSLTIDKELVEIVSWI